MREKSGRPMTRLHQVARHAEDLDADDLDRAADL